MKTNIKMKVTPEQSKDIQWICFVNNVDMGKVNVKNFLNSPYLFINGWWIAYTHNIRYYNKQEKEEIDADLFIRTNGTCEEFTCEHPGVDNTTGKCITCGEHIDKSDFEPKIQSSALSSEQLKLFIAGRNFEIPQYLANNPTKLLKELNSALMKATKTTSINLKPECQFTKYGFEKPDFECEILKEYNDHLIGAVYQNEAYFGTSWTKEGTCLQTKGFGYINMNLKPIKKPWYETCKFPCVIMADYCMPVVVKHYDDGYVYDFRDNKYCVKQWRLITNDEIEGLKQ